jgi:hypothetical protein
MNVPPAPLFRDPIHDGAADPVIIWNRAEQSWWLLYTDRRANVECRGVAWVHGTDIGVASSSDAGHNWLYRGILRGLEFEAGHNTFWAPEVIWHDSLYHMYVTYLPGIPDTWSGPRSIIHMTSRNLWDWQYQQSLKLSSDQVIDAAVHQLPGGRWRMWYKDEGNLSHTYAADSDDLYNWSVHGAVVTDCPHEGPNVFCWQQTYWMITDPWNGLGVYRSDDAEHWERQDNILDRPGARQDDGRKGGHADVLVQGGRAFIFYFTHPERDPAARHGMDEVHPYNDKRTSIQVAELEYRDKRLACDRDKPFDFTLQPGE